MSKNLSLKIENLIFYSTTKIILICGKLDKPLISDNQVFLNKDTPCKVKVKSGIFRFEQLNNLESIEFSVEPTYEEKPNRGELIKQFTANDVLGYHENSERKAIRF